MQRFRIVLVRPRNPMNIGASARAMANFGFDDLVVVDPYEPVWRETRSAPDAEPLVHKARLAATIAQAIRGCDIVLGTSSFHQRPAEHAVVDLPELAGTLHPKTAVSRAAILFGSERGGLSNAELAACRAVIRIPTTAATPSMNLAQSVAVVCYELTRLKSPLPPRRGEAGMGVDVDLDSVIENWIQLAEAAGYPPGYSPSARAGRIRRIFQKARLHPEAPRFLNSFSRWLLKKLPPRPER